MSGTENRGIPVYNVISICIAFMILTAIVQGVIMETNHNREVAELKQALQNELAIRTIEPVVWVLGNYPGSDVAKSICEKAGRGERIATRLGTALVQCRDPEGKSAVVRGRNLDEVPTARATFPHGRGGPLAELETNPNSRLYTDWYIFKNGEE